MALQYHLLSYAPKALHLRAQALQLNPLLEQTLEQPGVRGTPTPAWSKIHI